MHWIFLMVAIVFEVIATTFLKFCDGWPPKLIPAIFVVIFFPSSTFMYMLALKKIDISTAYPIWSGLGVLLILFVGIWLFKEQISLMKGISLFVIVAGITGLFLSK